MRGRVVAVLVGVVLAALGPAAASAAASGAHREVLFQQPVGPSGVSVPSNELPGGIPTSTEAMDDFVVPAGTRWRLEGITVFGTPATRAWRGFNVRLWDVIPGVPYADWYEQLLHEGVQLEGGAEYTIPIDLSAPLLGPGDYWIAVQQTHAEQDDSWSWLTGPDTPGTMPASFLAAAKRPANAEAGQAFQIIGTPMQTLTVSAEGYGLIRSEPPGIACTTTCTGEFPRGTDVKLTEEPSWGLEFKEWQWGTSLQATPPCTTENDCTFALNQDTAVLAKAAYRNDVTVVRLVRDRRTGGGELVVWLPNEGVLSMSGRGLRSVPRATVPEGRISIPLVPRGELAQRLLRKGWATVSLKVRFRPAKGADPATLEHKVTLVRKVVHKPAHRVH
jgi:hypothetical protein